MAKDNLETKSKKAVIAIKEKVTDISNVLYDLSMKLCHIIKYKKDYFSQSNGNGYYKQFASIYNAFNLNRVIL